MVTYTGQFPANSLSVFLPLPTGMVDHHTLIKGFWGWWNKERARRGYSPGNWKWIIPPISPTASRCYLELNKMTEYTLKPVSSCQCTCTEGSTAARTMIRLRG